MAAGTGEAASGPLEVHRLSALARADQALAGRLQTCATPEQIVALAEAVGCRFSVEVLREESRRNLGAPYWPWGGQSRAWRQAFFGESAPEAARQAWGLGSRPGQRRRGD